MKKYELVKDDFIKVGKVKLYRIKALKDFGDVKVGDLGGYIEGENNLSHDGNCWVYDKARVYGKAWVCGHARIFGYARVAKKHTNLIQIQGSEHFVTIQDKWIQIGCILQTKKQWLKSFKKLGKENGYTPEQIKEYESYINQAKDCLFEEYVKKIKRRKNENNLRCKKTDSQSNYDRRS